MADKKENFSAHNPQFESGDIQEPYDNEDITDTGNGEWVDETIITENQDESGEPGDSLSPMRKEWIPKDVSVNQNAENIGKLKTSIAFETGNPNEERAEIKTVDPLGSELTHSQTLDMHEESLAHENGTVQQQSIETQENGTVQQELIEIQENEAEAEVTELPTAESEHEEKDEREKVMPMEIRQKVRSVIPALLNVVEDDKQKCCDCNRSCTVSCLNTCCLPCNNPCKKTGKDTPKEKFHIFNEALQKGSAAGRAIFQEIIFPLIRPFTRDMIAISEFLIGLVGLILSIVSFSLGNNAAYNILHLVLAILSTILGFTDMVVSLKFSSAFAKMIKSLRNRALGETGNDTEANGDKDPKQSEEPSFLKKGWDTGRILISEAILYPLLVCDLIEFIVDRGYEVNEPGDIVNLILFIISLLSLIFYVYIVRLGVLIAMVIHLHKCRTIGRTLSPEQKEMTTKRSTDTSMENDDSEVLEHTTAKKAKYFQVYFIFHVMGQMAAQIMMIVAVSLKIVDDNKNKTLESPLYISGELWFLLTAGYIMPFLGILSFFVPTFYWVYEHENGLCIDFLSLLTMPGIDHILYPDGEEMKEAYESIRKIASKLHDGNDLRDSFKRLQNVPFFSKLSYAFRNPFLVVACLMYSFTQFAFVMVVIVGIQNANLGTIVYYIISIIIGVLANVYVFLVAALWTAVIVGILVAIASVIALIAGICLLFMIGQSCATKPQRNVNL